MMYLKQRWFFSAVILGSVLAGFAAPVIDPIASTSIPAGKSLILPVTGSSPNGRPLTYSATSSTNRITVEVHTNNPFWKMSVVQLAASNAPGAFQTPFRGGVATVTNVGDMTFMLFRDRAPHSVDVISGLTMGGFYNSNTIFHRVATNGVSVIQGGDPGTNGLGGPVFRYDDEFHPRAIYTGHGQLALANSGPDTAGSQFFVTVGPQRNLDLRYTIIGQLLRGFGVLTNVFNTPLNGERPLADVIITRASLVPNATDTVITLNGTNLAGVAGTMKIIADDGVGGRTTNTFTATTVADSNNARPILYPQTVTNFVTQVNTRLTNFMVVMDLEGNGSQYDAGFTDSTSFQNASNSTFTIVNNQLQFVLIPRSNYVGPIGIYCDVAPNIFFNPYDEQVYTFGVGDTVIMSTATNLVAPPLVAFTDQLLATFTNGGPNSSTSNFSALINWGDNSTNSGVIVTNAAGRKEVRGSHTYTNSGNYPINVRIRSVLGAEATVISAAVVPPSLNLYRNGTSNSVNWPAWAVEYQLQSHSNLATINWVSLTNIPVLAGYDNLVTNTTPGSNVFFRLKR
jgi:cyclophilin family peptidyl-prolyl cis-trans isomerase